MVFIEVTNECAYALLRLGCCDPMFPVPPDSYLVGVPLDIYARLLERKFPHHQSVGDVLYEVALIAVADLH
jgi:hypothetical protein